MTPPTNVDVQMPQMGESLAEGTIVRWLKAEGDLVDRDEPLVEISTDKVDAEIPAPLGGTLRRIVAAEGETVPVGATLAIIEAEGAAGAGDDDPRPELPIGTPEPAATETADSSESAGHFRHAEGATTVRFGSGSRTRRGQPAAAPSSARRVFSPAVLETARHAGLSLDILVALPGSGRGGRITKRDVERALVARDAPDSPPATPLPPTGPSGRAGGVEIPAEYVYRPSDEDRVEPMSPVRRKIAHHMAWSARISPHATAFAECDMSQAAAVIGAYRSVGEPRAGAVLSYTVLAAHAAVRALAEFPALNASIVGDSLVLKPHVHLGVAVALRDSDELVVPVVREADGLSLEGLASAIRDLASRARARRLTAEEVRGGTFTLTNPGAFGGLGGTPILNQPQVAILGLGAIVKRPVVVGDAIAIRPIMQCALTFDHRATDGLVAFRYLDRFCRLLGELPPGFEAG